MSKRIFTKVFKGSAVAAAGPYTKPSPNDAMESWLVQESIEVIGANIKVYSILPSENDGFASYNIELSQVGVGAKDGAILCTGAAEGWNTAPPGISEVAGCVAVSFPQGMAIPVKEEGYLYVNGEFIGKSAGVSAFEYEVIVYYIKKSSR